MPPEPIEGRRTATEPTADDPARAAAHTARRHAPSPRPRRDPHVLLRHDRTTPASVHTAARRALRTSRRFTLGHPTADDPHRPPPRTVTAPPTRPPRPPAPPSEFFLAAARMPHEPLPPPEPIQGRRTATEPTAEDPARAAAHTSRRHAPSPRSRRDPHVHPRHDRTTPLPHECLTSPCRPSQSTGDAPRRSQHRRSGARRRPFRPPPRTVTTPPTRPPRPPTPRQDHARFSRRRGARSGRAAASR